MNPPRLESHSPKPPAKRLAWEVEINGLSCIVFAETKAKARWIAVHSYREAYGHGRGYWPPRLTVVRRPHLDNHRESQSVERNCFGLDQL